jgi:acyl carrier protein
MISAPINSFGIDSLETMEFINSAQDRLNIELNEEALNPCRNLHDLAVLAKTARRV